MLNINYFKVYKLRYDMEQRDKDDRAAMQHERTLQEYFVRTLPLGSDRNHSRYWAFAGDDRLFVQTLVQNERPGPLKPSPLAIDSSSIITDADDVTEQAMQPETDREHDILNRLYQSKPYQYHSKWSIYCGATDQWQLWDSLDGRGERERQLKAKIKAQFDIQAPAQSLETEGSDFIGRKVERVFGKRVSN